MSIWAIVPFKGAKNAKRRLSPRLPAELRSQLVLAMLDDVLEALTETRGLDGILLVSRSDEAKTIARDWQVTLYQDQAHSLVDALIEASAKVLNDFHATTTFIVPGDVPLITGRDAERVLSFHTDVTIVPDRRKIGTNALLCSPPNAFPFVFDGRSYRPHIEAATKVGLTVRSVESEAFAIDIDTAADLLLVWNSSQNSRTRSLLEANREFTELMFSKLDNGLSPSQKHISL